MKTKPILNRETISNSFPVAGWFLKDGKFQINKETDTTCLVTFPLRRLDEEREVKLRCWTTQNDGYFDINGTRRVLIYHGVPGPGYHKHKGDVNHIRVKKPKETVTETLLRTLDMVLTNNLTEEEGNRYIESWFLTSPLFRQIDHFKKMNILAERDAILLDLGDDYEDRILKNWEGRLDILSTTQGDKIGRIYRLVYGAKIKDGKIHPSTKSTPFCEVTSITVQPDRYRYDHPYRILPLRSAVQNHEELVSGQDPHDQDDNWYHYAGSLSGVNLSTCVMVLQDNYDDCIAISPGAARALACYVRKQFTAVAPMSNYKVLVQEGEEAGPGEPVVEYQAGGETQYIRNKFLFRAKVLSVSVASTIAGSIGQTRVRVQMECIYKMVDGCKLIQRDGNKGVVKVLPEFDEEGEEIDWAHDVYVHPKSVIARRLIGFYKELNNNSSTRLSYGKMFWMRTKDHAQDKAAGVFDKLLDHNSISVDRGKTGGQRMGPDMGLALLANGLPQTYEALIQENIDMSAVRYANQLFKTLSYQG